MAQTANINIKIDSTQANASVGKMNQAVNGTIEATKSLKAQLKEMTMELQGLEPGSARFNELTQAAGHLKDKIQDTNAVIAATAGAPIENLARGLGGVAKIGVAGFQGVMGAMAMFGVENENVMKTMVALQGAMAFTQALETFGALGDTITNIKASFGGLASALGLAKTATIGNAVATTALATAEGAQATATGVATTAQIGLNAAMAANPIGAIIVVVVALIAAVSALAYALSMETAAEKKANEERKKQEEIQKAIAKQKDEDRAAVTKEISGFVLLTYQIRQSNAGSKERKTLIDTLNSTYGTTLKNMSDEAGFQRTLNILAQNYILFATNKVKVKRNEAAVDSIINKKLDEEAQLRAHMANLAEGMKRTGQGQYEYLSNNQFLAGFIKTSEDKLKVLESQLTGYANFATQLNAEAIALQKSLGIVDKPPPPPPPPKKDKPEKEVITNEQLIKAVDDLKEKKIIATLEEEKNLLGLALKKKEDAEADIEVIYKKSIVGIEREKLKAEAIKLIDDNYKKEKEQIETQEKKVKDDNDKKELDRINQAKLIELDTQEQILQFTKKNELEAVDNSVATEEEKVKQKLEINKRYANEEIALIQSIQKTELDIRAEKYRQDKILAETNKESTLQLEAQYNKDVVTLTQTASDKVAEINKNTKESVKVETVKSFKDTMGSIVEALDLYGAAVMNIANALNDLFSQQNQQQIDALDAKQDKELTDLTALYETKQITEDEYNAKEKLINQQREQEEIVLRRKQFQRDKANNIANAIMAGAQAVLSALATMPPASYIMAGLNAALSAVQIATISQQQFKAARGGIVPGNGNGAIDSVPSLLAPGEAVINSTSASMFPETLSMINQAGGGVSFTPNVPSNNVSSNGSGIIFQDNNQQQAIRAYVVETEITNSQKRVSRIERSVEF
jgi:hypothetical protein